MSIPHLQSGFSLWKWTPRETTFGAGIGSFASGTVWPEFNGLPLPVIGKERISNAERAKGFLGPTAASKKVVGTSWAEEVVIEFPLRVDLFQYFLKLLLSNGVEAGAGPYTQTMKEPAPGTAPWSAAFVAAKDRADTATFFEYRGVICSQVEVTFDDSPEILCRATVSGDGSEVDASALSAPAVGSSDDGAAYCIGRNDWNKYQLGPTGSERDILTLKEGNSLTIRFVGEQGPKRRITNSLTVPAFRYGQGPAVQVEGVLAVDKADAPYGWFRTGTPVFSSDTSVHFAQRVQVDANNYIDIDLADATADFNTDDYDELEGQMGFALDANRDATAASRWTVVCSNDNIQNVLN